MDKESVAIEIDKYLLDQYKTHQLAKIVRKEIIEDFIPSSLHSFSVDKDSIKTISITDNTFEFIVNGEMVFIDKSSKVRTRIKDNFHGIAHIAKDGDRYYVDCLEIDSLPSSQKILSFLND